MSTRTKLIITVSLLGLVDVVIPIPILGFILMYVLLERPPRFRAIVDEIYYKK